MLPACRICTSGKSGGGPPAVGSIGARIGTRTVGAFRVSPRLPTLRMMIVIRSVVCEQGALSRRFVKVAR